MLILGCFLNPIPSDSECDADFAFEVGIIGERLQETVKMKV